jgi:hypothetical protein
MSNNNLQSIMEIIDDNKENMNNNDYLKICNLLKEENKNISNNNIFKCTYLYPYIKKINLNASVITYKKKISLVKLDIDDYEYINSLLLFNDVVITNDTNDIINKLFDQLNFRNKFEYVSEIRTCNEQYMDIHKIKLYPIILSLNILD